MSKKDINIHLNYVMAFILVVIMAILYHRYVAKNNIKKELNDLDLVRYYLLNDAPEEKELKTILWIHIPYELNSRSWESFYSRSSRDLNLPYIYLCIKSIVEKCGKSFHVVLIDDNSFKTLLPEWNVDLSHVGSPNKEKLRYCGLAKLLYKYGGLLVPKSMLTVKNLMPLYVEGISGGKPFFVERVLNNMSFTSNHKFIGCEKECPTIKEFIGFLEASNSLDYTDESNYLNLIDAWIYSNLNKFNKICGSKVGVKDTDKNPIMLEDLFSEKPVKLPCYVHGIVIPEDELNKRTAYNWFSYLPENEIIRGNSFISKYFLMAQHM